METTPRDTRAPDAAGAYIVAALLIVIGAATLIANLTSTTFTPAAIPLAIGIAFMVAYALTRRYGFLVPAGVLTGFGAGALISSLLNVTDSGAYIVLGGGAGFLMVYVLDVLVLRSLVRWWPLIPGGILTLAGTAIAEQDGGIAREIGIWSPAALILLGVLLLFARPRRGRA